ncbi:9703_t:CDS:2, partial [Dentiscutata erythropus]
NINNDTNIIEEQEDPLYNKIRNSLQKELKVDPLTVESLFDNLSNKKCKKSHPLHEYLEPSESGFYICYIPYKEQHPPLQWQKSTGISTIKSYFKKYHTNIYNKVELEIKKTKPIQPYRIDNESKVKRITYLLIKWIICNQQSFIVIKDSSFIELIEELDEWYRLPSRQTISNQIKAIYKKQQLLLKEFLKTTRKFAITTDLWTACNNSDYLSIMLHWINDNWTTLMLSSSSHPTLEDLHLIFTTIKRSLEKIINNTVKETTPKLVAIAIVIKLDDSSSQTDTLQLTSRDYFKKALKRSLDSPDVASELRNYLMLAEVDCEVLSWWRAHANNQN